MVQVGHGVDVSTMIRTASPLGSRNRFAAVSNEIWRSALVSIPAWRPGQATI